MRQVNNNAEGLPQKYKNLSIYPLKLKDISYYNTMNRYLALTKNHIPEKDIIKMSMLKFIIYVYQREINRERDDKINVTKDLIDFLSFVIKPNEGTVEKFDILFEYVNPDDIEISTLKDINTKLRLFLCLTVKNVSEEKSIKNILEKFNTFISYQEGKFSYNNDSINKLSSQEKFDLLSEINCAIQNFNEEECVNLLFTEQDFDQIREIILSQNGIELEYLNQFDPSLEDSLQFMHRNSNYADFEEQIFSFAAYMRTHTSDICENYTFYQFKKYIQRTGLYTEYMMMKPLELSGQIKLKHGTIEHWLSHIPEKGRYDEILISKDKFIGENDIFKASQLKQ